MSESAQARTHLPWRVVLGYGLGDMANNFSFALGLLFLLHYYTDVAGIPAAAAGTLLVVVRIYDAFMDIAAGRVIDRHRGFGYERRWGRLRPWLLVGALPVLVLNVAVFSVPAGWSPTAKLVYAYLSYGLLGTAYAFVSIAYGSLAGVMTQSPPARARLGAVRTWMSSVTFALLGFAIAGSLRSLQGEALQSRLTLLTVVLAGVGLLLYALCFFNTSEVVPRKAEALRWRDSLPVLRQNLPLQRLCLVTLAALAASGCGSASGIYFARYVLGNAGLFSPMILTTSLTGIGLAVPLAPLLAARLGKVRAFQLGMLLAALGHAVLWWLPAGHFGAVLLCMAIGAAGATLGMVLLWALEADTVEYGEWRSGLRLEGTNYALFLLTRKCGLALGAALPAFMIASSGYVPNLATQSDMARQAIVLGMALLPALGYATAGLLMLRYPLSESRYLEMLGELRRSQT
ncbi:glycoside-pentoside-hexuronide (GPH):cation symporter [Uliginosibacterium sp. H3]|uniref:Glycoside-pentoside-hexuronide (GPH):cation symporter n=1 Tax=Uliginosibacterium silvisoli TaxID=3114758 RepID=A0ABU6K7R8_9RHOO|nr:glycoside-pentoside-hexuronide (GPH):cation symporter [Uliginosibacterium sp. H3]